MKNGSFDCGIVATSLALCHHSSPKWSKSGIIRAWPQICTWSAVRGAEINRRLLISILIIVWILVILPHLIWGMVYLPVDLPKDQSERSLLFRPLQLQYGITFGLTIAVTLSANIIVYRFVSRHVTLAAANLGEIQTMTRMRECMTTAVLQLMSTTLLQVSFA